MNEDCTRAGLITSSFFPRGKTNERKIFAGLNREKKDHTHTRAIHC